MKILGEEDMKKKVIILDEDLQVDKIVSSILDCSLLSCRISNSVLRVGEAGVDQTLGECVTTKLAFIMTLKHNFSNGIL